MKNKLERITLFSPAFDKRDPVPSKNYGIGAARCFMILKGKDKVAHFIFSTGIFLPSTVQEYAKDGKWTPHKMQFTDKWYIPGEPMGFDVGYHSIKKNFKGQTISRNKCEWLDGRQCFGDGSALRAEEWMKILIEKGSDEIWKMLEEEIKTIK